MAITKDQNEPIAVVGNGHAGVAALINTMVGTWYDTPDDAPAFTILIIKTGDDGSKKNKNAHYPLGDMSAGNLHPFYSDQPPTGFPTFGKYVEDLLEVDVRLSTALVVPTYGQVTEYLQYVLELAIVTIADKVLLEAIEEPIQDIQESHPGGPATILFKDGTSRKVKAVVRSRRIPHMGGIQPTERATVPALDEDSGLHPSRRRFRDYLVIEAGKLVLSLQGQKGAPAVWTYFADRKPVLDAIPAEQDLINVPYLIEDIDYGGTDFEVLYFDPPHTGAANSYLEILEEQEDFLCSVAMHRPVDSRRAEEMPAAVAKDHAFSLLWHAVNKARDERGPDYTRAFVRRLHQHRWLPGSGMGAYLLVQADGGFGREVYKRAADSTYIMSHVTGLKERIDQARNEVSNLTEWTETLYLLNPEVQEVMAYLERSELKHTKEWHQYYSQVNEDIMTVHRLNVSSVAHKYQGAANSPTWITTYLTDLRTGKSAAEYRQQLDHLFQERVTFPKYWGEAAASLYDTAPDAVSEELTDIDPYRAVSIEVLESWSQQWRNAYDV